MSRKKIMVVWSVVVAGLYLFLMFSGRPLNLSAFFPLLLAPFFAVKQAGLKKSVTLDEVKRSKKWREPGFITALVSQVLSAAFNLLALAGIHLDPAVVDGINAILCAAAGLLISGSIENLKSAALRECSDNIKSTIFEESRTWTHRVTRETR